MTRFTSAVKDLGAVRDPLRTGASRAAEEAARGCGVLVDEVEDNDTLRDVSALLESVWGRSAEGVPIPSDVMRSLVHAGGCITAARDSRRTVVGAAVLVPTGYGGYSLIAATAPHQTSRGLGRALKLRQRAWALGRGWQQIQWTFDPLVSRNARFNLGRLGALATAYEQDFYGHMADDINANDDSDRLVAMWKLDTARAITAADGPPTADLVPPDQAPILSHGPDGQPLTIGDSTRRWCRVPDDIITIRREQPELAQQWRQAIRTVFRESFADGFVGVGFSRSGWYTLDRIPEDEL